MKTLDKAAGFIVAHHAAHDTAFIHTSSANLIGRRRVALHERIAYVRHRKCVLSYYTSK